MVPDNLLNTSSSLFPNTAVADLGISSDLSQLNSLVAKSIGSPSILNSERTASQIKLQDNDSLLTGDGSGIILAEQAILRDINDSGQIIGSTSGGTGATATSSPFLLQNGQKINIGSFGGATGAAAGINQFGQVVGVSQNSSLQNRAFVWNNGVIKDLNGLVLRTPTFSGSNVTLTNATGINNFGDISAFGSYTYRDAKGVNQTGTRAYLLKAIPTT